MKLKLTLAGLPLLAAVLTTLKLAGVIAAPWLWVLAPLWVPLALALIVVAAVLGTLALMQWIESR